LKLSASIGTSLGCAAIIAAAAWHYVAKEAVVRPDFWQHDPIATAWTLLGGVGGTAILAYVVLSFLLLTAGAVHDLVRVRARLDPAAADPDQLKGAWQDATAETEFEPLAVRLPAEDLTISPLALLRVLRFEAWRIYGTRLAAAQLVTLVLAIGAIAAAPYLPTVGPVPTSATQWEEIAALAVLASALGAWLLIDGAIHRLAATLSSIAAAWEAARRERPALVPLRRLGSEAGTPTRIEAIAAAIDKLAESVTERSWMEIDSATQALASLETAVREAAARQNVLIGGLCETLTIQIGVLVRAIEQREPGAGGPVEATKEALTQIAAAVDKLDDTDRRLDAVMRRQEEAAGSVGTKWAELVSAFQAMSAGLDRFAQATPAAPPAASRPPQTQRYRSGPADVSDELQGLLDEMSGDKPTPARPPP